MIENEDNPRKIGLREQANDPLPDSRENPEVTGLGIIASLIIASCFLAREGTLALSGFLTSVAILLVIASALTWRIVKRLSSRKAGGHGAKWTRAKPD
jgi:hypothetical protein